MERINQLSIVLLFVMGLFVSGRREKDYFVDYADVPGDNIPTTLLEGKGR